MCGFFMNSSYSKTSDRMCVVVLGYIVRCPIGGLAWHYLQYVMGLARLGHEVYYVEDSCLFETDEYAWCYDPVRNIVDPDPTPGLRFAANTFERLGLGGRWAYYDAHKAHWYGPCAGQVLDICSRADLLLNVSGANPLRPWLMQIPIRVLVDTDPVFTQIRQLTNCTHRELALQHTAFFSFGENIGDSRCTIPQDGLPWQATRQPIILDAWPVTPGPVHGKFTTVMAWESYHGKTEEYGGVCYGLKAHSFEPYMEFPQKVGRSVEMSLFNSPAPRQLLRSKGWSLRDGREPTRDPWTYQHYINRSKAEFSVAKHGYVVSHSGWFSERSACYLASGRPVLLQDTGFSEWLPTGIGVVCFRSPEEAVEGFVEINNRYEFHCDAAREIAAEYFDSGKVLCHLLECALER